MLWTDSLFVTIDDLTRIDSEVVTVAKSENIVLDGDNGMIRGAVEEASQEIMKYVIAFGGYLNSGDLTANHLAAVLNVGIGNSVRQKIGLQQIVVSGEVPSQWNWLKQWVVQFTLRMFYRNAFSRVGGDRYKTKMDFYKEEAQKRVTPTLWALGVPIVIRPLSRPSASYERDTGTWDADNVTLVDNVAGTMTNQQYCDVAITYCDMSQANFYVSASKRNNAESDASDKVTQQMTVGSVLHVDISSLNPPPPLELLVLIPDWVMLAGSA